MPYSAEEETMSTYDFVHLVLYAFNGTMRGRTKFQKTVYFVGALTRSLENLGYRPHYYGPYSSEVAAAANELTGLGFLRQTSALAGGVDPQGFEVARYDYDLTTEGRKIAREKAARFDKEWSQIDDAVRRLKLVPDRDYIRLSIAAKMYYLLGKKKPASTDELVKMMPTFGWSVTAEQMREAGEFLVSLGLVHFKTSK